MLKIARLLTRPTPERQYAPFREQGRSKRGRLRLRSRLSEDLTFFIFASTLAFTSAFPEPAEFFSILLEA